MNIYLVSRTDHRHQQSENIYQYVHISFICVAVSEEQAKGLHPVGQNDAGEWMIKQENDSWDNIIGLDGMEDDDDYIEWCKPSETKVEFLGEAVSDFKKPKILMRRSAGG